MAFRIVKLSPNLIRMMSTNAGSRVGFIGLGQMGNRMATNLINKVFTSNILKIELFDVFMWRMF